MNAKHLLGVISSSSFSAAVKMDASRCCIAATHPGLPPLTPFPPVQTLHGASAPDPDRAPVSMTDRPG